MILNLLQYRGLIKIQNFMNNTFTPNSRIRILTPINDRFFENDPGKEEGRFTAPVLAEFPAMIDGDKAHIKPENSTSLVTLQPGEFLQISSL